MYSDFIMVIQWWGTLFLVGAAAYPLTKTLFSSRISHQSASGRENIDYLGGWWDRGYLFTKATGMATVTYLVYLLGTLRLLPFSQMSMAVAMGAVFVAGVVLSVSKQMDRADRGNKGDKEKDVRIIILFLLEEAFFFTALLFWAFIKAHEPSIHGLEKFMDFGFTKSILDSTYFPATDIWYSGGNINYYYFGHIVMAMLTKFSGLDLRYTFNLMLATIFAFTSTMSFSIGYQLLSFRHSGERGNPERKNGSPIPPSQEASDGRSGSGMTKVVKILSIISGLLTAFLVTLAGNLQTIYAFTMGYTGDQVKPFWQLLWPLADFWQKLPEGLNRYWYANATRFIPYTIHEFPSYSFVVSDIHGHVLSLPFVLLAIALLISMFINQRSTNIEARISKQLSNSKKENFKRLRFGIFNLDIISDFGFRISDLLFYGFLVAVLLMTNALDGPVYFGLFMLLVVFFHKGNWGNKGIIFAMVAAAAGIFSLPFILHFQSFVHGLAVNCPPAILADSKIGPFLFEGVEKCQHSPVWMVLLLWGFFIYCGGALLYNYYNNYKNYNGYNKTQKLLIIFFFFSLVLIIFPEFFYFKDIYPMHFRSNTMFKLGYQAFILFSIVSGYTIVNWLATSDKRQVISKKIFFVFLIPLLFLVSIYPIFSVRSYFDSLRTYKGLDGLAWIRDQYPSDYAAIEWLNKVAISSQQSADSRKLKSASFSIVEADGDSYTDSARFSAFTGLPTIIGWPVHEWLWRGSYDIVAPRRADVEKIYESQNLEETRRMLKNYNVKYVIVGVLEREKYAGFLNESKFLSLGKIAFRSGETVIYEIQ